MTLTEFLLARVAEDEADARDDFADGALHRNNCEIHPQGLEETACNCDAPERAAAECEAKRRIVKHVVPSVDTETDWQYAEAMYARTAEGRPNPLLAALALPYADHSDYRQEWRP